MKTRLSLTMGTLLLGSFFSIQSAEACRTDRIVMMRSTGFGLSLGSGRSSFTGSLNREIQIPLRVGEQSGCMTQESGLDFEAKTNKRGEFQGEFNIYPPRVKFKNVKGRVETFLKIIPTTDQNKLDQLKVSLASFTCSGNALIAVEGFEGSVRDAAKIQNLNVSISQVFATGAAARNLAERRQGQYKIYGKTHALPQTLKQEFINRLDSMENLSLADIESQEVSRPSILMSTSLGTGALDLDASFSTVVSTKFGCSPEFKTIMADFHLSNIQKQLKSLPFKSKVDSKKIRLRWK